MPSCRPSCRNFALERADLFKRRLEAYRQRDGLQGLPIAVADTVIDLLNPACVDIVSTVREAERNFGCSVGLIGIDTYAKGTAANGGDEDKAKDQNRAAANPRSIHSELKNNVHIGVRCCSCSSAHGWAGVNAPQPLRMRLLHSAGRSFAESRKAADEGSVRRLKGEDWTTELNDDCAAGMSRERFSCVPVVYRPRSSGRPLR
jgi:hypothetical protein